MSNWVRASVAALAFAGLVAQPIAANACCWCPPPPPPHNAWVGFPVAWALGFFLCAGMTVGQQDTYAKKHHTKVSGNDRARGFVSCILPPIGFNRLDHHRLP